MTQNVYRSVVVNVHSRDFSVAEQRSIKSSSSTQSIGAQHSVVVRQECNGVTIPISHRYIEIAITLSVIHNGGSPKQRCSHGYAATRIAAAIARPHRLRIAGVVVVGTEQVHVSIAIEVRSRDADYIEGTRVRQCVRGVLGDVRAGIHLIVRNNRPQTVAVDPVGQRVVGVLARVLRPIGIDLVGVRHLHNHRTTDLTGDVTQVRLDLSRHVVRGVAQHVGIGNLQIPGAAGNVHHHRAGLGAVGDAVDRHLEMFAGQ